MKTDGGRRENEREKNMVIKIISGFDKRRYDEVG